MLSEVIDIKDAAKEVEASRKMIDKIKKDILAQKNALEQSENTLKSMLHTLQVKEEHLHSLMEKCFPGCILVDREKLRNVLMQYNRIRLHGGIYNMSEIEREFQALVEGKEPSEVVLYDGQNEK